MRSRLSALIRYTEGDCWYLALILHRLYGFEIWAHYWGTGLGRTVWNHVFVKVDDSEFPYLDVNGRQSPTSFGKYRWESAHPDCFSVQPISNAELWTSTELLVYPKNYQYVYQVAHRLVKRHVKVMGE